MSVIYLNTYGSKASLSSERLIIEIPDEHNPDEKAEEFSVPLLDVSHLVVNTGVHLPAKTLARLSTRGIPVLIVTKQLHPLALTVPAMQKGKLRWQQFECLQNPDFRLNHTIVLVKGKMRNQYRQLQRLASNRKLPKLPQMVAIHQLANQLSGIEDPGQAFGIEGMASAHYYEALGQFFPSDLPFDKRSRRPPKDPANALLSYLYTLLSMETAAHLWATGLDPAWGLYHATADNRYALALDMVEPIRPILDGIALDLINHKRLKSEDFTQQDDGYYLAQSARPTLYKHLEKSLEREYNSRHLGHNTTLRKHLRHQCLTLRKAITAEGDFETLRSN